MNGESASLRGGVHPFTPLDSHAVAVQVVRLRTRHLAVREKGGPARW